jgi:hypothetical protein
MLASSILPPGAITSPRPASWRWAITTARRDGRGMSSRGSRPFGAELASQDAPYADTARNVAVMRTASSTSQVRKIRSSKFEEVRFA